MCVRALCVLCSFRYGFVLIPDLSIAVSVSFLDNVFYLQTYICSPPLLILILSSYFSLSECVSVFMLP